MQGGHKVYLCSCAVCWPECFFFSLSSEHTRIAHTKHTFVGQSVWHQAPSVIEQKYMRQSRASTVRPVGVSFVFDFRFVWCAREIYYNIATDTPLKLKKKQHIKMPLEILPTTWNARALVFSFAEA